MACNEAVESAVLLLLLGGDFHLQPASLEANFPPPAPSVLATSNILFSPCTLLLDRPFFIGGTALIVVILAVALSSLVYTLFPTVLRVVISGIHWKRR